MDGFEVETPLESARHLMHATIADICSGDDVEAGPGQQHSMIAVKLRHHHQLFRDNADQDVLDFGRTAGDFLESDDQSPCHTDMQRPWHERARGWPLGQQQGVVPGILDLIFRRAGRALNGVRRTAGNGRRQQFGQHRLGRAGLADKQQPTIPGQPHDGTLDQDVVAEEFAFDLRALAATNKGSHRLRGQFPAWRPRLPFVALG